MASTWLFAVLLVGLSNACGDVGCDNAVLSDLPSADGRRHAVVCSRSCGATTGFSTQVSIVSNVRSLEGSGNVFVADADHEKAPGGSGGGPVVAARWLDARTLQIRYDDGARVFQRSARHDDIDVRYIAAPPSASRP
jgi:hypothetical protein